MVQVPEAGATNLIGMKIDFEIKGRGPDPIVRKGKEISRTSLESLRKANIGEVEIDAGAIRRRLRGGRHRQHRNR